MAILVTNHAFDAALILARLSPITHLLATLAFLQRYVQRIVSTDGIFYSILAKVSTQKRRSVLSSVEV
jgi:hypothetical protein